MLKRRRFLFRRPWPFSLKWIKQLAQPIRLRRASGFATRKIAPPPTPSGHPIRMGSRGWRVKLFLLVLIFLVICAFPLWLIESQFEPTLATIAKTEAKKIVQQAFLKGVEDIQQSLNKEKKQVAYLHKDQQGRIAGISFDSHAEGMIYQTLTNRILHELKESQDRELHISLGKIAESSILSDFGPSIPLEVWIEGSPHVTLTTKMEETGINTTMVNILVHADIEISTLMPFAKEHFAVKFDYPIIRELVVGEVPSIMPDANKTKTIPLVPSQ
ncbi:sporulation protein YunB [Laceyella putida]|uniref:Sporulation protein YunB n=1 Tax=Laceyella putida TaxID=110101 RepID=A0ABW2RML2_9BACL